MLTAWYFEVENIIRAFNEPKVYHDLSIGKNVHLSFLTFEMEDEQDCGYDFIEIFSGFDDTGPSYGRFCGNKIPPEIISVDDALLLRYRIRS